MERTLAALAVGACAIPLLMLLGLALAHRVFGLLGRAKAATTRPTLPIAIGLTLAVLGAAGLFVGVREFAPDALLHAIWPVGATVLAAGLLGTTLAARPRIAE